MEYGAGGTEILGKAFEQRPEGSEETRHTGIWEKSLSGSMAGGQCGWSRKNQGAV